LLAEEHRKKKEKRKQEKEKRHKERSERRKARLAQRLKEANKAWADVPSSGDRTEYNDGDIDAEEMRLIQVNNYYSINWI
jgi:hypothetical protein